MSQTYKIAALSHKITPLDPDACFSSLLASIMQATAQKPNAILCPAMSFTGASCGSLCNNHAIQAALERHLVALCEQSKAFDTLIVLGNMGNTYVIKHGHIISCSDDNFSIEDCGIKLGIITSQIETLGKHATELIQQGCKLILCPTALPAMAGSISAIRSYLTKVSAFAGCGIAVCNIGIGETSFPYVYQAFTGGFIRGQETAFCTAQPLCEDCVTSVMDFDITNFLGCSTNDLPTLRTNIGIVQNPYLPQTNADTYLLELFDLAAQSLAIRLKHTGIKQLVIGISGGLDSTQALLIAIKAMDLLHLPHTNITAITMPGFGTSDRTYQNAVALIERLGCQLREIPIKSSTTLHLNEIGHTLKQKDTTYENAQARERSQILLDVANMVGGLVVGTGDLSEEALGFSTFAGDHISNYNVNVCFTKNMIRQTISLLCNDCTFSAVADNLRDILDTPVSPELLPPDQQGQITQKTEVILGSYELHDFFLFYFVFGQKSPSEVVELALQVFPEHNHTYVQEKMTLFLKKFFAGQFKRSCTPDAACLTPYNLTSINFTMPSDARPDFFLQQL